MKSIIIKIAVCVGLTALVFTSCKSSDCGCGYGYNDGYEVERGVDV